MADQSVIVGGIELLRNMGFFDFLLPFLLFFSVIYGVLAKTGIFSSEGKERKDINVIIAFVIALISTTTAWVLNALAGFLPWIGFIAIVILAFLILGSMVAGGDVTQILQSPYFKYGGVAIAAIAVFVTMYYSLGWDKTVSGGGFGLSNTDIALIIIGIVVAVIFYIILKGGSEGSKKGG
jgi:heme/copper-type cytochrome/quinol oxidase subunit 4